MIFPQSLLHYRHTFPPLYEMPYAGLVKLLPEVLELLTCAVFQLFILHKMASLEFILEGAKNAEVRGWYMGTVEEDEGEQFIPHCCDCLCCMLTGVQWC
jgi:hypothetical protein